MFSATMSLNQGLHIGLLEDMQIIWIRIDENLDVVDHVHPLFRHEVFNATKLFDCLDRVVLELLEI
jgi:hypothetical protein